MGAHPDDVEIGVGGTAQRLLERGYTVSICILTCEEGEKGETRKKEAIRGAAKIGVPAERVFWLEWPDGRLVVSADTVEGVRALVRAAGLRPDVIFTHSTQDQHNDHAAAAAVSLGAFRETLILHYSIPNSTTAAFAPRLYIDTTATRETKVMALQEHSSQEVLGRLMWSDLEAQEMRWGRQMGVGFAESFEVTLPGHGVPRARALLTELNDCPSIASGLACSKPNA